MKKSQLKEAEKRKKKNNMEVWRDIKDYENLRVSNYGRIYMKEHKVKMPKGGYKKIEGRIKTQRITKNGYSYIHHRINRKIKLLYVHRLVAKAFPEICGEWFDGCQIDHINTIKTDNNVYNVLQKKIKIMN